MSRLASYSIGLAAALVLTSIAFLVGFTHIGSFHGLSIGSTVAIGIIMGLAFVQLVVQLYFFLHLGLQEEARWNTIMFLITFATIMLVMVAITWIMYHLNTNMMPRDIQQYITNQSSF